MAAQNNQSTIDALMDAILNLTNKFDQQQTLIKQQQKTIEQLTSTMNRTRDEISKLTSYNEEKDTVTIKVVLGRLSSVTPDINKRLKTLCALVRSFTVEERILVLIAKISKDGSYSQIKVDNINYSYDITYNYTNVVHGNKYEIKYTYGDGAEYIRLEFESATSCGNSWSSSQ
jgi:hypothetical protein